MSLPEKNMSPYQKDGLQIFAAFFGGMGLSKKFILIKKIYQSECVCMNE